MKNLEKPAENNDIYRRIDGYQPFGYWRYYNGRQLYNAFRNGARAAQIDEGLRAHMNKVYGTMSVGMLITALAAWAIAGLAVTTDPANAVGQMQNGTMLTALGAAIYTSALRWVIMLAPLGMVFAFGVVANRTSAAGAQLFFYAFAGLMGLSLSSILSSILHSRSFRHSLSCDRVCGPSLWGYTTKRYQRLGVIPNHGCDRHLGCVHHQYLPWIACDRICGIHLGCVDFCGPNCL